MIKLLKCFILFIACIFPRSKKIWIFGSRSHPHLGGFEDNSKYLYLWLSYINSDIKAVWIANSEKVYNFLNNKKLNVVYNKSIRAKWYAFRCSMAIYCYEKDAILPYYSSGAIFINLWHGVGIKKLNFMRPSFFDYLREKIFRKKKYFISTSAFMNRHFAKSFSLSTNEIIHGVYPRIIPSQNLKFKNYCEELFFENNDINLIFKKNKIAVYMPTFRDTKDYCITNALPNLGLLNKILVQKNIHLFIKLHDHDNHMLSKYNLNFSNISFWPLGYDVYTKLGEIYCLITDFSSIYFDYILATKNPKPILYLFDEENYQKTCRNLIENIEDNCHAMYSYNFDQLCENILRLEDYFIPTEKLNLIRRKFWSVDKSAQSCEEFVNKLKLLNHL